MSALRLLITSGMMWYVIDPICLVEQVLRLYMAVVVGIVALHDLVIHTHHENRVGYCCIRCYFSVTFI